MAQKKTTKSSSKKPVKKATTTKKSTSTRSKKAEVVEVKESLLSPQVKAILLCAASLLFFAICFIQGEEGNAWFAIRSFFKGTFGACMFLIPLVFLYLGILTAKEKEMSHKGIKITFSVLIVLFVCTLIYLFGAIAAENNEKAYFEALGNTYMRTAFPPIQTAAGLFGALIGYPMFKFFSVTPSVLITIICILVSLMLLTGVTLVDIANLAKKQYSRAKEHREERIRIREEQANFDDEEEIETKHFTSKRKNYQNGDDTRIDIPIDNARTRRRKVAQEDDFVSKPLDVDQIRDQEIINIINNANNGITPDEDLDVSSVAKRIQSKKNTNNISEGAVVPDPETVEIIDVNLAEETAKVDKQIKRRAKQNKSSYRYPPIRLLEESMDEDGLSSYNEMQENANKLIDTLQSFNVKANITNINRGPSVTRYELQPAPGVKISKITNLSDDIALALAASGVRIEAPIPGKAAVGIEVPNKSKSVVSLVELIDSEEFKNAESKLTCALGKDISGGIVLTNLATLPHMLIAGTTGSGKSVCVNTLLMSILFKASPEEVKLLLIDPKMVEFNKYKGIPHLLVPVVSDVKKAAGALNWAVNEMLQRYKLFSEYDCKDIQTYNQLIERNLEYIAENKPEEPEYDEDGEEIIPTLEVNGLKVKTEKMCQIVIAIDELADLMMVAPSEVEESICRLAQMARAAGMHLIIATQRPSVNVITGVIKANIPSRIALKVSSAIDSRTILDTSGAEKLIGHGDMLYMPVGANKATRVQCCFARDEEIESVTSFIKDNSEADYDEEAEESIRKITAEGIGSGKKGSKSSSDDIDEDLDPLMEEAIKVVVEAGQASTSMIQRRLKVGYARAGRLIDDMEQMGIVGPHQGSKSRDVLMTHQEWLERSNAFGVPSDESDE